MENPRSIGGWATAVLMLLYIGLGCNLVDLALAVLRLSGNLSPSAIATINAPAVGTASILSIYQVFVALLVLVTYFVFGRWIWLASRNLWDRDLDGLNFTPASCIWWYAVPLANWVMPFRAMSEIWNGSHGADHHDMQVAPRLVSIWWGLWVANGLIGYFTRLSNVGPESPLLLIISGLGCGLYWFAIQLVSTITRAQRTHMHSLSEVFA